MEEKKKSQFILYIGIKGAGDMFTNEVICGELIRSNLSIEYEGKDYKDTRVHVWQVDPAFVNRLYASRNSCRLEFIVFSELNHSFQQFCLLEPLVKKKAKQNGILRRQMKKIKERGKGSC
jgi:hypothetical protein